MRSTTAADVRTQVHALALVVTPVDSDACAASRILTDLGLCVHRVRSYRAALAELVKHRFVMILTDLSLGDGSWKDILGLTAGMCEPPRVMLLAPGFDAGLCAEALTLGAHDVLARPLDEHEIRSVAELAAGMLFRGGSVDAFLLSAAAGNRR